MVTFFPVRIYVNVLDILYFFVVNRLLVGGIAGAGVAIYWTVHHKVNLKKKKKKLKSHLNHSCDCKTSGNSSCVILHCSFHASVILLRRLAPIISSKWVSRHFLPH